MKKYSSLIIILCICSGLYAQKSRNVASLAKEAYGEVTEYQTKSHLKQYQGYLNRIQIVKFEKNQPKPTNYLSKISIFKKYNPNIKRENSHNFDSKNFNPLKYAFNYYSNQKQFIKVDNTNFYIIINPNK